MYVCFLSWRDLSLPLRSLKQLPGQPLGSTKLDDFFLPQAPRFHCEKSIKQRKTCQPVELHANCAPRPRHRLFAMCAGRQFASVDCSDRLPSLIPMATPALSASQRHKPWGTVAGKSLPARAGQCAKCGCCQGQGGNDATADVRIPQTIREVPRRKNT